MTFYPGSRNLTARLTEKIVQKIRTVERYKMSVVEIAKKYGVSQSCIRHILLRNSWKHI